VSANENDQTHETVPRFEAINRQIGEVAIARHRTSKYRGMVARQTGVGKLIEKWPARKSSKSSSLVLIGLFKLFKALLLIAIGVMHWTEVLRVDPENRLVHGLLVRIFRVTPRQLKELSLGTFLYAGLFATEGVGLLLRKRWAEYFTIVTTSCSSRWRSSNWRGISRCRSWW
jgi:hypothetical protein